ncbi:MAG: carboxypeptidase-like regulatory domain-containing protein [Muribaculaceae bacterium]|nr:carboxypeptidase-like regulatory domain-containing protein [Muribaculaceae bacterium]
MKKAIWSRLSSILFVVVLCTISFGCSNSNDYEIYGSIHGCITDHTDGQPLENATVLLSPSGITKQTDISGNYDFINLESRQYTLTVQKQGYQPNRKTITVITGENLQVDIQLSPIPQQ